MFSAGPLPPPPPPPFGRPLPNGGRPPVPMTDDYRFNDNPMPVRDPGELFSRGRFTDYFADTPDRMPYTTRDPSRHFRSAPGGLIDAHDGASFHYAPAHGRDIYPAPHFPSERTRHDAVAFPESREMGDPRIVDPHAREANLARMREVRSANLHSVSAAGSGGSLAELARRYGGSGTAGIGAANGHGMDDHDRDHDLDYESGRGSRGRGGLESRGGSRGRRGGGARDDAMDSARRVSSVAASRFDDGGGAMRVDDPLVSSRGVSSRGGRGAVSRAVDSPVPGIVSTRSGNGFVGRHNDAELVRSIKNAPKHAHDYIQRAPQYMDLLEALVDKGEGWVTVETKNQVRITKKKLKDIDVHCFKGTTTIRAPHGIVFDHILNSRDFGQPIERSTIEEFHGTGVTGVEHMQVFHVAYGSSTFMASDRDFCLFEAAGPRPSGAFVILHRSVNHPACKEKSSYVRGEVKFAGYVIAPSPKDPHDSIVSSVMQIDAQGWVSTGIGETMAEEHVAKLSHVKSAIGDQYAPARRGLISRFTRR